MDIPPAGSTEIERILGQPEQIGKQVSLTERLAARPQLTTRRRKVTTEILVETTESILIRRQDLGDSFWCSECGVKTEMLSLEQAALTMGASARSIHRWIEAGRLHVCEPRQGILRVCLRSLTLLSKEI